MSKPNSIKHSLMTSTQEILDDTADTSQLSSFEVDNSSTKFKNKNRSNTLLNNGQRSSDTPQGSTIIVHPSYSRPTNTAFHYQAPLTHSQGFISKFMPQSNSKSPKKLNYLPPQQYGGMLEELETKDKSFKIQMTEDELNRNQFSCYKCWLLIFTLGSVVSIASAIWLIVSAVSHIPIWTIGLFIFLMTWNLLQCALEYIAIQVRSFNQAENALKSFCLFLLVLFASSIAINLGVEMEYMQGYSTQVKILIAIAVSFAVCILYYISSLAGAIKVYQVLKKKESLETSLKEEIMLPGQLHCL